MLQVISSFNIVGHNVTAASASIPSKYQTIVTDNSDRKGFLSRTRRFNHEGEIVRVFLFWFPSLKVSKTRQIIDSIFLPLIPDHRFWWIYLIDYYLIPWLGPEDLGFCVQVSSEAPVIAGSLPGVTLTLFSSQAGQGSLPGMEPGQLITSRACYHCTIFNHLKTIECTFFFFLRVFLPRLFLYFAEWSPWTWELCGAHYSW